MGSTNNSFRSPSEENVLVEEFLAKLDVKRSCECNCVTETLASFLRTALSLKPLEESPNPSGERLFLYGAWSVYIMRGSADAW